jgi:hypothetical protein
MTRSRSARVAIALALTMFVGVSVVTLTGQAPQTPRVSGPTTDATARPNPILRRPAGRR